MQAMVFRRRDYSTGMVAAALGIPRQDVTDTIRRAHLPTSATGAHARLGFAEAVAVGLVRALVDSGLHVHPAGHAARAAMPALEEFVELLIGYAKGGADPLQPGGMLKDHQPYFAAHLRYGEDESGPEFAAIARVISSRSLQSFLEDESTPELRDFAAVPITLVVPLMPILRRLAAGLALEPKAND